MNSFSKLFALAKNFLFPARCVFCGCLLLNPAEIGCALCANCRLSFPAKANISASCSQCGKPLISEKGACLLCRKKKEQGRTSALDRMYVIYPYTGKYRKLLAAYKFKKNLALAEIFAEKIMEAVALNPELKDAVIVPVPPRPGKIRQSGWDQVEYLVKKLRKNKNLKVTRCLKRKKSQVQKKLNRKDREENLKGRIYVKNKNVPDTALIIDDVITTGSTIETCSSALKAAGTEKVFGLCLFYD